MSPAAIVVLLLALIGIVYMLTTMRPDLKGEEARRLVAAGARLVDVRTPGEFASGHLPDAVNIPLDALKRRQAELGPKDGEIILYCASGARSGQAKRALRAQGFVNARNLGSIEAW